MIIDDGKDKHEEAESDLCDLHMILSFPKYSPPFYQINRVKVKKRKLGVIFLKKNEKTVKQQRDFCQDFSFKA
ncbi:MAG: hypothetical protein ACLTX6_10740 [Lachnospiraceae bacterium]